MEPERWLELRLRASTVPEDVLVEGLLEFGGRAVWEEEGWQVTHLPDPGEADAGRELLARVAEAFPEADDLQIETRWQRQEDWAEFWKRGLEARRLTARLVVTPTWIDPETGPDDIVIALDPKMAFGNAEHGTTRGCLRLLDRTVAEGDRILDVGAGSAILSIAAALMGAERVDAIEADPLAMPAARENLDRNGVSDRVGLELARVGVDDLAARGPYDGVMANIEWGFLRPLLPGLVAALRPGGWLLLSGILDEEWEDACECTEALSPGFELLDADGEWRSGRFRKPE